MSAEQHTISFDLTVNVEEARREVARLQTVLSRSLALSQRMGLPDRASEMIAQIQRIERAVLSLRAAYLALQAARMAAGDPLAWATAGLAVGALALDIGSDVF